jgi:hypothetical protein
MATPNFSALLPDVTLRQMADLAPLFNGNKTQIVIRAIAQLHKEEIADHDKQRTDDSEPVRQMGQGATPGTPDSIDASK